MVEWFPGDTWIDHLLGATSLIPFLVAIPAVLLLFVGGSVARRLAAFLFLSSVTAVLGSWSALIETSDAVRHASGAVFRFSLMGWIMAYVWFAKAVFQWRWLASTALVVIFVVGLVNLQGTFEFTFAILYATASVALLTGFAYAIRRWAVAKAAARRQAGIYTLGMGCFEVPFMVFLSFLVLGRFGLIDDGSSWSIGADIALIVGHFGAAVAALVLTYGALRYQMFDFHRRVRITIRSGTLAAIFVGIFSVVTLAASEYLVDRFGYIIGAVAAVVLLAAVRPLRGLADRVADRAVPNAKPMDHRTEADRLAFYQEQVEIAFGDGSLTPKELAMLDRARQRLGLSAEQALAIQASMS